jgi:hypothetical protein
MLLYQINEFSLAIAKMQCASCDFCIAIEKFTTVYCN